MPPSVTRLVPSTADAGRTRPVFVSLTTIASRLSSLGAVLDSLLAQTRPPERVILWLSERPFLLDAGVPRGALPAGVAQLVRRGRVAVRYTPNTGPYRKLVPVLGLARRHRALIATADDDVVYPRTWLQGLCEAFARRPGVTAYRSRAIVHRDDGLAPYRSWPLVTPGIAVDQGRIRPDAAELFHCATGRDGVLYDPAFLPDAAVLRALRKIAPRQDDLAFKLATLVNGIPTYTIPWLEEPVAANGPQLILDVTDSLWDANRTGNDAAANTLFAYAIRRGWFEWNRFLRPREQHLDRLTPASCP